LKTSAFRALYAVIDKLITALKAEVESFINIFKPHNKKFSI